MSEILQASIASDQARQLGRLYLDNVQKLKQRGQYQLDRLFGRVRTDIVKSGMMAVHDAQDNSVEPISFGESLVTQLGTAKAMERLTINLLTAVRLSAREREMLYCDMVVDSFASQQQ